jgi:hypothetical protein
MKYILALGNIVDGLEFIGPFADRDAAVSYGESYVGVDWCIAELKPQEEEG